MASKSQIREVQVLLNRYFKGKGLGLSRLKTDGVYGKVTQRRVQWARYFLGVGPSNIHGQSESITPELMKTLRKPRRRIDGYSPKSHRARIKTVHKRQAERREYLKKQKSQKGWGTTPGAPHWGGSTHVILPLLPIAQRHGGYLASAKRASNSSLSRSNPGSDHNEANIWAYANDYGIWGARGTSMAYACANSLGLRGYRTGNYNAYRIVRHGHAFAVQGLWQVSGHYDHNHWGCHRA